MGQWSDCMRRGLSERVRAVAEEAGTCWQCSDVTGSPRASPQQPGCPFWDETLTQLCVHCLSHSGGGGLPELCTHPISLHSDRTSRCGLAGQYCRADRSGLTCPLPNTSNWIINSSLPWNIHKPRPTGQVRDSSLSVFSILILYVSPAFFFPWLLCKEITAKWRGRPLNILKSSFFNALSWPLITC